MVPGLPGLFWRSPPGFQLPPEITTRRGSGSGSEKSGAENESANAGPLSRAEQVGGFSNKLLGL